MSQLAKAIVVLYLSLLSLQAVATPPAFVQLDARQAVFFAVSVRDVDKSVSWYSSQFGLKQTFSFASETGDVKIAVLAGNGLTVELQQHASQLQSVAPVDKPFLQRGIFKVGVYVVDVDAAVAKLQASGSSVVLMPFNDATSQTRTAIVADIDNNYLQLFQRMQP